MRSDVEARMARRAVTFGWVGVVVIGLAVVIVVLGLQLFPRLNSAQDLIDDVRPALTADRVAGDIAGVAMVSTATNTLDPAMYPKRGDVEWPKLIALLAERTGRSDADMRDRLEKYFPSTVQLLNAMPLSQVAAETPKVMEFVASTLGLSLDQWYRMLAKDFPQLNQQVNNLPNMTEGWDAVPGTEKLTRFNGAPVRTMPQVRDYFQQDLMPAFDRQQANFRALDTHGGVGFLASLLLGLGMATILFGTLMAVATAFGLSGAPDRLAWVVVSAVGAAVVGLVFALNLYPRLDGGQRLLDDTRPVFTVDRVDGARAGVDFISTTVNALGPGVLLEGGGRSDVVKLLVLLSDHTGMPPLDVKALLKEKFPHATNLLASEPFSDVTAENSEFYDYLATNLKLPPGQGQQFLKENFPNVSAVLTNLAGLTNGWAAVPGTEKLTRFDGTPVRTVPQLRDYFRDDVIPVLVRQQANYARVDTTWPPLPVFPPLLTA
ncbi:MAG: hypothetical protein ACRDTN_17710, partial [Mycobacterium sp.]